MVHRVGPTGTALCGAPIRAERYESTAMFVRRCQKCEALKHNYL